MIACALPLCPESGPKGWRANKYHADYAKAFEGAYFAKHLEQARQQGRIGQVAIDPILPVKAFMDIGGAGHSSDAMAIWICQFVGREISYSITSKASVSRSPAMLAN